MPTSLAVRTVRSRYNGESMFVRLRRNHPQGFTLLELMVVVAIMSVLAATAIPRLSKYIKKAKTSEARLNLRKIYDGELAYFYEDRVDQAGVLISRQFVYCVPVPAHPPIKDKRRGNFDVPGWGWQDVNFGTDSPIYYIYHVEVEPAPANQPVGFPGVPPSPALPPGYPQGFVARAQGNLDGDSEWSLLERIAAVNGVTGEIEGGAAIFILDELE